MILADTSVWVDHLRRGVPEFVSVLEEGTVLVHPFVLGELACGHLRNRETILRLLGDLPEAATVTEAEAMRFIELHSLMGRGIGYIDVHLLASTALTGGAHLWTRVKRLADVARDLGLDFIK